MKKENRLTDELLNYGSLGIEMLVAILIGTLAGYWLDGKLNTRPWLMLLGFILGAAAGFRGIFRLLKNDSSTSTRSDEKGSNAQEESKETNKQK
jgi:ATP synthase protein I